MNHGGDIFMIPVSPSTITSRPSAAVSDIIPIRPWRPENTSSRIYSLAVRVFPKPRPARRSHPNQSPSGANCSGRAQNRHSYLRREQPSSPNSVRYFWRRSGGIDASRDAVQKFCEFSGHSFVDVLTIFAGIFYAGDIPTVFP